MPESRSASGVTDYGSAEFRGPETPDRAKRRQAAREPAQPSVLYITYDGALEPLGHSQVVQYLTRLAREHRIVLLSYEKKRDWLDAQRRNALRGLLSRSGIRWIALRYHKKPSFLATAYDLLLGTGVAVYAKLRYRIGIVHARSYVGAVPALALKALFGTRFVFDMRGFWADEKVERGTWRANCLMYRLAKRFERLYLSRADVVVSLTHAAVPVLREFSRTAGSQPEIVVIRTCVDLTEFRPKDRRRGPGAFTLGHIGSTDTAYMLEPALRSFKILSRLRCGTRMLFLTQGEQAAIRAELDALGISQDLVEIKAVPHERIADELVAIDAALFVLKPSRALKASCPTKLGELLACGIPCLTNEGTGDITELLEGERVGVVVRDLTDEALEAGMRELLRLAEDPETRTRCMAVAVRYFSLDDGARAYGEIYRSLGAAAAGDREKNPGSVSLV